MMLAADSAAAAGREALVPLAVVLISETPRAILVRRPEDEGAGVWLPKSQITREPGARLGRAGVTIRIVLPRWLAEQQGLAAAAADGQERLDV